MKLKVWQRKMDRGDVYNTGRPDMDDFETPEESRRRVEKDIADGKRCGKCWLLNPCLGHAYEVTR